MSGSEKIYPKNAIMVLVRKCIVLFSSLRDKGDKHTMISIDTNKATESSTPIIILKTDNKLLENQK